MSRLTLILFLCLTLVAGALPGLSPVWERLHNHNEPFSETNPAHAPTADPDGDGWNNRLESIAGTDPFSGLPGDGLLQAACAPAPWPPDSYRIEWQSQIGKKYQLAHSADLVSWFTVPNSITGSGRILSTNVSPVHTDGAVPDTLFWRVIVSDEPAPGGAYSPYELHLLATRPDLAASVTGPGGGAGSGGNPNETNSDGTGPVDAMDAAPHDNTINWNRTPEAKYLFIPAGAPEGYVAIDVNDRGQILFKRTDPVTNYASDPVAKIWDPSRPENERFIDVIFQPVDFTISLWKSDDPGVNYPGEEDPVILETAPIPTVPPEPNRSIHLRVEPRFIGPDGSVMANVSYSLYEFDGDVEKQTRGARGEFVFLWKGDNHDVCRILGQAPGYKENVNTVHHHYAAGFHTDTTGGAPDLRALFSEQPIHLNDSNATDDLSICAESVGTPGEIWFLGGEPARTQNVYPNPIATPSGRVLVTHSVVPGDTRASVCGNGGRFAIPVNTTVGSLTDVPVQAGGTRCGIGDSHGPFQFFNSGNLIKTGLHGVIQFDKTGTGISGGKRPNEHLWRNARWMSLREAAGLTLDDTTLNDYIPKKITEAGIIWVGNQNGTSNGVMIPGLIIPDENMAGVIGDVVEPYDPSSSMQHFVTPKKSEEIPQDYVEVVFANFDAKAFSQIFDWEGGEAGSAENKRKVSRSSTGMTELKVKLKGSGIVVVRMRVWVVWSQITQSGGDHALEDRANGVTYWIIPNPGMKFVFKIEPSAIITDAERPGLYGEAPHPVPGKGKPHSIHTTEDCDSASNKWDVSRKFQLLLSNPDLMESAELSSLPPVWLEGQPQASFSIPFPQDPVEGNDDPLIQDEHTVPYQSFSLQGREHQIGEMSFYDSPRFSMLNSAGGSNRAIKVTANFKEFSRLEIWDEKRSNGRFWYRISDYELWHHKMSVKYNSAVGKWEDNGSSSGLGLSEN